MFEDCLAAQGRGAACPACPLAELCLANRAGDPAEYPVMPAKKPRRVQPKTVLLLVHDGRTALGKRPDRGLLAGLWEFPNVDAVLTPEEAVEQAAAWGCEPFGVNPCGEAVHIFSHIEWHMTGYLIPCGAEPARFTWADAHARRETYAVPAAFRAYKTFLERNDL